MSEYRTFGDALTDPNSNISRFVRTADAAKRDNNTAIAAWMATGLTREQAWEAAINAGRKGGKT